MEEIEKTLNSISGEDAKSLAKQYFGMIHVLQQTIEELRNEVKFARDKIVQHQLMEESSLEFSQDKRDVLAEYKAKIFNLERTNEELIYENESDKKNVEELSNKINEQKSTIEKLANELETIKFDYQLSINLKHSEQTFKQTLQNQIKFLIGEFSTFKLEVSKQQIVVNQKLSDQISKNEELQLKIEKMTCSFDEVHLKINHLENELKYYQQTQKEGIFLTTEENCLDDLQQQEEKIIPLKTKIQHSLEQLNLRIKEFKSNEEKFSNFKKRLEKLEKDSFQKKLNIFRKNVFLSIEHKIERLFQIFTGRNNNCSLFSLNGEFMYFWEKLGFVLKKDIPLKELSDQILSYKNKNFDTLKSQIQMLGLNNQEIKHILEMNSENNEDQNFNILDPIIFSNIEMSLSAESLIDLLQLLTFEQESILDFNSKNLPKQLVSVAEKLNRVKTQFLYLEE